MIISCWMKPSLRAKNRRACGEPYRPALVINENCATMNDNQHDYESISQALEGLKAAGYQRDFNLLEQAIECSTNKERFEPSQFTIVQTYRFEGFSNPDDNAVLYAIETEDGSKGTLMDAYGAYSQAISREMIEKFRVDYKNTTGQ